MMKRVLIAAIAALSLNAIAYVGPVVGGGGGGTGSVTTISFVTANGISCTVSNPTTTPNVTCSLGNITPADVTPTGRVDFTASSSTAPFKSGTVAAIPATCVAGKDVYFATNATAGQNLYFCTATNTWTQQLNSGGGGVSDGNKGSITVSGGGTSWTINSNTVSNAMFANMAASSIKCNNTGSLAAPIDCTAAQAKTLLALVKADVGLGNVDNTADASKPVSTAQQTALDAKANLAGANAFLGNNSYAGSSVCVSNAMGGGTAIDLTKCSNSKSVSANTTFTFAAAPTAGTTSELCLSSDPTARTITLPSFLDLVRNITTTTFVIQPSTTACYYISYNGSIYKVAGPTGYIDNAAASDPAGTDDITKGYGPNSRWLNTSNGHLWVNQTNTAGSATWSDQGASGSMVYPGAGIPVSTGSAWGTSKATPSGAVVGDTDAQSLSGKTFVNPANTTQALTDGATINWDASAGQNATVTIAGNRTFAAPTNLKTGGIYRIKVKQDATGNRTATWNAVFKWPSGTAPTLSTAANAEDSITCTSFDATNLWCGIAVNGASTGSGSGYPASTWASKPGSPTNGLVNFMTDVGVGGSLWRYNSTLTRWQPVGGDVLLYRNVSTLSTSSTTTVKMFSTPLYVGMYKNGDVLRIRLFGSKSGTADTCRIDFRIGADDTTGVAVHGTSNWDATSQSINAQWEVQRTSTTATQRLETLGTSNGAWLDGITDNALLGAVTGISDMDAATRYLAFTMSSSATETCSANSAAVYLSTGG